MGTFHFVLSLLPASLRWLVEMVGFPTAKRKMGLELLQRAASSAQSHYLGGERENEKERERGRREEKKRKGREREEGRKSKKRREMYPDRSLLRLNGISRYSVGSDLLP